MVPVGEGRPIGPHRLRIRALRILPGHVYLTILIINREEFEKRLRISSRNKGPQLRACSLQLKGL